tara:strand:+ start:275 stop:688 length:414 start_codon:yes stop_codon:yes gene_type:complete
VKIKMSKEFKHEAKIYYEDTDSGGVVYYANYLKFLERARTEMIASFNLSNKKLLSKYNTLIMVKSCNIDFINPAKLEDKIQIFSSLNSIMKASFLIDQKIKNKDNLILEAKIRLVTVNPQGKPIKIPEVLIKALKKE